MQQERLQAEEAAAAAAAAARLRVDTTHWKRAVARDRRKVVPTSVLSVDEVDEMNTRIIGGGVGGAGGAGDGVVGGVVGEGSETGGTVVLQLSNSKADLAVQRQLQKDRGVPGAAAVAWAAAEADGRGAAK